MKKEPTSKQIGQIGEEVAAKFLVGKGFEIVGRNYRKFFGEIDIIARKKNRIYFFEVKSVRRDNLDNAINDGYRPEDNLHPWKVKKLVKTINYYLLENKIGEGEWQLDALTVLLDTKNKKAKVKRIENIVL